MASSCAMVGHYHWMETEYRVEWNDACRCCRGMKRAWWTLRLCWRLIQPTRPPRRSSSWCSRARKRKYALQSFYLLTWLSKCLVDEDAGSAHWQLWFWPVCVKYILNSVAAVMDNSSPCQCSPLSCCPYIFSRSLSWSMTSVIFM